MNVFINFFNKIQPDVIHVHTLMGLYSEFLEVAKKRNIKIVFTTHDYFGISPHPKFYLGEHDFVDDKNHDIWNNIRAYGSPTVKLRISQLSTYPLLRTLVKKIKKSSVSFDDVSERINWSTDIDTDFQKLRNYYLNMLKCVDIVHFNSSISKKVYEQFLPKMNWKVHTLTISSNNIEKSGEINLLNKRIESIAYIGPYTKEKGFFNFLKFATEFMSKNANNKAFIMGDNVSVQYNGIKNLGPYDRQSLIKNLEMIDLIILPSKWHEAFGLIAMEVLSTGTKVVVSKKMGVSDMIPKSMQNSNINKINIENIGKEKFKVFILSMSNHEEKIMKLYVD